MSCVTNSERRIDYRVSRSIAASGGAKSISADIASRVLILNCNPSAPDIREMAERIKIKETNSGKICRIVNLSGDLSSLTEMFDELIITSHHSFYTKDEHVSAKPIEDRELGDVNLSLCAELVSNLVTKHKVFDVQFYACEFALSEDTRHMGKIGPEFIASRCPLLSKIFSEEEARRVDELCKTETSVKVSSLEYITSHVCRSLINTYNDKEVKLRGLTGVGYIDEKDLIPKCFDRDHYEEYLAIKEKEVLLTKQKNSRIRERLSGEIKFRKIEFEEKVDNFDSPHQIEFVINPRD